MGLATPVQGPRVTKATSRDRASDFAVDSPLLLNSPPPFIPSKGDKGPSSKFTRTRGKVRDPRPFASLHLTNRAILLRDYRKCHATGINDHLHFK